MNTDTTPSVQFKDAEGNPLTQEQIDAMVKEAQEKGEEISVQTESVH